jgi:hypothetical protein
MPTAFAKQDELLPEHERANVSGKAMPSLKTNSRSWARALLWKVWIPIPVILLLLDATFNLYFWKIPKLTPRSVDYRYQFLIDAHHISQPKPPGTTRVVAFGSSIAQSFDPHQVQSLLHAAQPLASIEVNRLLVPGIKPSDYEIFFQAEQSRIQPDVAVVLLNFVDFVNPSFERELKPQVRYVLPPLETLKDRHAYMSAISEEIGLGFASISNLYRYRKLIRSSLQDHVKLAFRWLRTRTSAKAYGVYPDGYTAQRFGVPADHMSAMDFEYYVHPEWIRQRGEIALNFSVGGRELARRVETQPGWKTIHLLLPPGGDRVLDVKSDSAWTPRAGGRTTDARILGLQLRQLPADSARDGKAPPLSYPPVDDRQIGGPLRMGDAVGDAFVERWDETIRSKSPFAIRYRAYRDAELELASGRFAPTGEYAAVQRLVADLSAHGTSVVVINNPESPLLLEQYNMTPYYRAHVEFLRSLAGQYDRVSFYDLADTLPAEDFNDWHHINYIGTIKLGLIYQRVIAEALSGRTIGSARAS